MINAGEYDQRLTLQQPVTTQDAAGQPSRTFTDVDTVWGKARPTRGRDFVAADGKQSTIDVAFEIRYRADVTAAWRVVWKGAPYDIQGEPADIKAAGEKLELNCVRGVRDGVA